MTTEFARRHYDIMLRRMVSCQGYLSKQSLSTKILRVANKQFLCAVYLHLALTVLTVELDTEVRNIISIFLFLFGAITIQLLHLYKLFIGWYGFARSLPLRNRTF